MRPLVISYARFSSAGQADGTSLQRQFENAEAYAKQNGLAIDPAHTLIDAGISGFDGSNVKQGALGQFLTNVKDGKIPRGSTLIVESFDRLSRTEPLEAVRMFADIVLSGVTVVTLTTPPKKFTKEGIKDNFFQLMEAMMEMYRAHGESDRKSGFGLSNWAIKKKRAVDEGVLLSAKAPHWITVTVDRNKSKDDPTKRTAVLNEARAKVALKIIKWAEDGIGNATIIRRLNEGPDSEPPWSKRIVRRDKTTGEIVKTEPRAAKWEPSYIQKMLTNPALYGAIELDGELHENFYPHLIKRPQFERLKLLRTERATRKNVNHKGKSLTNLFSGIAKCGYCGEAMNVGGYKVLKGRQAGYARKYIACHGARIGATRCRMHTWFIDELEGPLLTALWRDVDYSSFSGKTDTSELEKAEEHYAYLQAKQTELNTKIANGEVVLQETPLKGLALRVQKMEQELDIVESELKTHKHRVDALAASAVSSADIGAQLKGMTAVFFATNGAVNDELQVRTMREQISATVHNTISRIVMFPVGRKPGDVRSIEVHFKTGDLREFMFPKQSPTRHITAGNGVSHNLLLTPQEENARTKQRS